MTAWDGYSTCHQESAFAWGWYGPEPWSPSRYVPGVEVLDPRPGTRALDLGCGAGDNAAHLAGLGPHVTAIDQSPVQVATGRQRWGHVASLDVVQAEAVAFMRAAGPVFDVIYSVYGAAWFTDPEALVPAASSALGPTGLFACSHADVDPPEGRVTLDSAPDVQRWELSPLEWRMLLRAHGFREVRTIVLPPTLGFPDKPTILVIGQV